MHDWASASLYAYLVLSASLFVVWLLLYGRPVVSTSRVAVPVRSAR